MRTGRPKTSLTLSIDEHDKLATWAQRPKSTQRLALRAKIVLACAAGLTNQAVAQRLQVTRRPWGSGVRALSPTDWTAWPMNRVPARHGP